MHAAEALPKYRADVPRPPLGAHLWAYSAVFRVSDPANARVILDTDNLVTIDGPGCYWCEKMYTPEIAAQRCVPVREVSIDRAG